MKSFVLGSFILAGMVCFSKAGLLSSLLGGETGNGGNESGKSISDEWIPLLSNLEENSDEIGGKIFRKLIGMLPGFEMAMSKGDLNEIRGYFEEAAELFKKSLPHLHDEGLRQNVLDMTVQCAVLIEKLSSSDGSVNDASEYLHTSASSLGQILSKIVDHVVSVLL